jgi:uncharacterized membrane protein YhaH (DUF805 family)
VKWFFKAFDKYAVFRGRAQRLEFWMFQLLLGILGLLAIVLIFVLGDLKGISRTEAHELLDVFYAVMGFIVVLPNLAVHVRRLHDTGRSAWYLLIGFIPLAYVILLIFMCQDSEPGANRYGVNPKQNP